MAAQLFLGEDLLAPGRHLEHSAGGWDQPEGCDFLLLCLEDFFRHTDGMREIPSAGAVLDGNLELSGHATAPPLERLSQYRSSTV